MNDTGMYNASKGALTAASETWRLELAPLGVRVITLVAGGIQTNFLENTQVPLCPESSYYRSIWDLIVKQPEGSAYSMPPTQYARDVFNKVNNGATGKIWVGSGASIVRFLLWMFPQKVMVCISMVIAYKIITD